MSPAGYIRCRQCRTPNESGALFCGRCGASLGNSLTGGALRPRRRVTAAGVAMGFALFLILLATTFILGFIVYRALDLGATTDPYAGRTGTTATIVTESSDNPGGSGSNSGGSSSSKAAMIIRPRATSASSVLEPTATSNFRPPNLVDGDLTTAWCEGKEGAGTGEWVRFEFLEPVSRRPSRDRERLSERRRSFLGRRPRQVIEGGILQRSHSVGGVVGHEGIPVRQHAT